MLGRPKKERSVKLTFLKPEKIADGETITEEVFNSDNIKIAEEAFKRAVQFTATVVAVTVISIKVVDTLSQIAIKKTKSADSE